MALWYPSEDDLRHLDTLKARDLIIQCFFQAQKENLVHNPQLLDNPAILKEVRANVVTIVKETFAEVNGYFNRPTVEILKQVVERLAEKSRQMGNPPHIINHHLKIITTILRAITEHDA